MRIKRVKITKASSSNYWYTDKIGQEVHVFDVGGDPSDHFRHKVIQLGTPVPLPDRYLGDGDFEVLEVFEGGVVERVTLSIQRGDPGDLVGSRGIPV